MFNSKKESLFETKSNQTSDSVAGNAFLQAAEKVSAKTVNEKGAPKYSTTGSSFVDQFGKLGTYKKPRTFAEIASDASVLWADNALLSVAFILYMRIVTRIVSLFDGSRTHTPQRGAGLKHESIVRMIWLNIFHRDTFWKNIQLFISAGSWKDVFVMLSFDLQYNGWKDRQLDWENFGKLILAGLENTQTTNLVKKYLPTIRANSKCTTVESQADNMIAKWLCSLMYGSKDDINPARWYREYRKMKTSGNAHEWQKLISRGKHDLVDFNTVPGRALSLMVSSKYLSNHKLESKYEEWLSAKPVAKFTGFVHELFKDVKNIKKKYQIDTLNKQFEGLVQTVKKGALSSTSMIVVRDTSGSMSSEAIGIKMSSGDIAKAIALFMSHMLPTGHFANSWIEFNADAELHTWKGSTPYEKWTNDHAVYVGTTDFQSVIDLFVKLKRTVSESEFPSGIICISDGEFNASDASMTNFEHALFKLRKGGFSEEYVSNFKIVLWNIPNNYYRTKPVVNFESYGATVRNIYYFSGYDPSVIAFLTGLTSQEKAPQNAEELFQAAMNQELLQLVEV